MEENNNKIRKYNIKLEAINNKLIIMENKAIKMLAKLQVLVGVSADEYQELNEAINKGVNNY